MFCVPSDFDLPPYNIPNLNLVVNTFQTYVDKKEMEVLKRLLGVQLYNDFIQARQSLPAVWGSTINYVTGDQVVHGVDIWAALADSVGVVPDENASWTIFEAGNQWLKLEKGSTYSLEYYSCSYSYPYKGVGEWLGLVDMLTPYIFSQWLRDHFDNYTGIGVVESKAENSERMAPARRIVDAFTKYAFKAERMQFFIAAENTPDEIYLNWDFAYVGSLNTFNL